jgi:hypothetical protein
MEYLIEFNTEVVNPGLVQKTHTMGAGGLSGWGLRIRLKTDSQLSDSCIKEISTTT